MLYSLLSRRLDLRAARKAPGIDGPTASFTALRLGTFCTFLSLLVFIGAREPRYSERELYLIANGGGVGFL
jgi:hypothetical protein